MHSDAPDISTYTTFATTDSASVRECLYLVIRNPPIHFSCLYYICYISAIVFQHVGLSAGASDGFAQQDAPASMGA
jgi:hypothetical protein